MRILLTSHGYPPTISGVTLVVQRLGRALVRRGHDVTVVAASERYDGYEEEDEGVRVVRLPSRRNRYWPANPIPLVSIEHLELLVEDIRPDVLHAHDALPFLLQAVRARSELHVPVMATCHYYPSFVATYLAHGEHSYDIVEKITWRYSVSLYNHVRYVVFSTHTHRDRFVEKGLESPTRIISNGVDVDRYTPQAKSDDIMRRYGLPSAPLILAVGRLAKDKNLEVLIRAMAKLRHEPSPHLLIIGKGPELDALESCAAEAGVGQRIHFLGFVPEDDLPGLYTACDAFAISSNHEVQSLPALQAAATGLPMVAAAQGSLPEICRDGQNGILVHGESPQEFARAFEAVLDPEAAARMRASSLMISRLHDERRTFDSYEALYRYVVDAGTGALADEPSEPERATSSV